MDFRMEVEEVHRFLRISGNKSIFRNLKNYSPTNFHHFLLEEPMNESSEKMKVPKTQSFSLFIFEKFKSMAEIKQAHAQLITHGLTHHPATLRPIISFCALHPSGDLDYAHLLLSKVSTPPTLFLFNTMIRGFALRSSLRRPLSIFAQMIELDFAPNNFTFTFLFQACSNSVAINVGRQLHSIVIKNAAEFNLFVRNSIIRFYAVCGKLEDARRLFDESLELDTVSWNSMIDGYLRGSEISAAHKLFDGMPERNVVSWNSLITGFAKLGQLDYARQFFDQMPERNLISWVTMINGYSQNGQPKESLTLFREMQFSQKKPNAAILVSVLSACSQLGALDLGNWIYVYIRKNRITIDPILTTSLIDMFAKCGNIDQALQVFYSSSHKNIFSYTAAILGLAIHGHGDESLQLFEQMKGEGIAPDCVSFVAVLCACSHIGLVEKGFYYFNSMASIYKINPELDHYACMVDLLGRAGLLEEAEKFIDSMPLKPDNAIWGALLGACRIHGNAEIGERVGRFLIESDFSHDGRYILLSNIYAESSKQEDVEEVMRIMRKRKIKRVPGFSSIEVNGVLHEFVSGDTSHPKTEEIYMAWEEIVREIRKVGYVVETGGAGFALEEEEKERAVGYHSEKLAIAFGFVSTEPGSPLLVVKNIRICRDCHSAIKLISLIYNRKISVRDRRRFHHFVGGSCTCQDYW